ncbi:hypothetical protein [Psychroflexus sp. MES1-P1E]|uniref:hypothetical protein n=1 Tax=Psychroflexus sp. MES1-P1E TaxID=2058320 RepID=UPI002155DD20|nr:hypothetical protein [Psychroflexus sp. MES1-P1E]
MTCSNLNTDALKSKGLHVDQELEYNKAISFLGGAIQDFDDYDRYYKICGGK